MYRYITSTFIALTLWLGLANAQTKPNPASSIAICVYGGTSAGVIAAYTAAKMNKSVVLIEPGNRLGGLSTGD
nr:FAD-dependent oxidoreductase [Mucilaginibacter humi]